MGMGVGAEGRRFPTGVAVEPGRGRVDRVRDEGRVPREGCPEKGRRRWRSTCAWFPVARISGSRVGHPHNNCNPDPYWSILWPVHLLLSPEPGRLGSEVILEASVDWVTGRTRNSPIIAQKGYHYTQTMVRDELDWMQSG
jgi:hypothetical protein